MFVRAPEPASLILIKIRDEAVTAVVDTVTAPVVIADLPCFALLPSLTENPFPTTWRATCPVLSIFIANVVLVAIPTLFAAGRYTPLAGTAEPVGINAEAVAVDEIFTEVPVAAPITGETNVGVVLNTDKPVPVSSDKAAANPAELLSLVCPSVIP